MILFLCYGSPHVNRFIAGVVQALAGEGVPALSVALDDAARRELSALGLDPLPLYPQTPLGAEDEAAVVRTVERFAVTGEVPDEVSGAVGGATSSWRPEPGDDGRRVRQRLRMAVRAERTARALLELLRPAAVVLWNGWTPGTGPLRRLAAETGLPTWFLERGPFPGTVQLDREGVNAGASFARVEGLGEPVSAASRMWSESVLETYEGSTSSTWEQPEPVDERGLLRTLGVTRSTRLALFPCQVREDVNIQVFAPHLQRYEDVYGWLGTAYGERSGTVVVAKRHPKSGEGRASFERALGRCGRWMEEGNIRQLLALCHHVVTVNSTVALEAMVLDRPVVVLGSTFFAGPGVVDRGMAFTASSPSELRAVVDRILAGERRPLGSRHAVVELLARLHSGGHLFGADDEEGHRRAAAAIAATAEGAGERPDSRLVALLRELGELRVARQESAWSRQRARRSAGGRILRRVAAVPGLRGLGRLLSVRTPSEE